MRAALMTSHLGNILPNRALNGTGHQSVKQEKNQQSRPEPQSVQFKMQDERRNGLRIIIQGRIPTGLELVKYSNFTGSPDLVYITLSRLCGIFLLFLRLTWRGALLSMPPSDTSKIPNDIGCLLSSSWRA